MICALNNRPIVIKTLPDKWDESKWKRHVELNESKEFGQSPTKFVHPAVRHDVACKYSGDFILL